MKRKKESQKVLAASSPVCLNAKMLLPKKYKIQTQLTIM